MAFVPISLPSMFGEDFLIRDVLFSDLVDLVPVVSVTVLPGDILILISVASVAVHGVAKVTRHVL